MMRIRTEGPPWQGYNVELNPDQYVRLLILHADETVTALGLTYTEF